MLITQKTSFGISFQRLKKAGSTKQPLAFDDWIGYCIVVSYTKWEGWVSLAQPLHTTEHSVKRKQTHSLSQLHLASSIPHTKYCPTQWQ